MRKMRKLTALILSAVMCAQFIPSGTAFAKGGVEDSTAIVQEVSDDTESPSEDIDNQTSPEEQDNTNEDSVNTLINNTDNADNTDITDSVDDQADSDIVINNGLTDENLGDVSDAVQITELGEYTATLTNDESEKWFEFIPSESKKYTLCSTNVNDLPGYSNCKLYDENMTLIKEDGNGMYNDFYITAALTAGKTYYFTVKYDPFDISQNYNVDINVVVSSSKDFEAYAPESSVLAKLGESATLSVVVNADDPSDISYEWYKDDCVSEYIIAGADSSSYTVNNISEYKYYYCIVKSKTTKRQNSISFIVNIDNAFKAYPSDAENHDNNSISYNIKPNESKTLSVTVEADDKDGITYKWHDNNWNIISGATSNSYEVNNVSNTSYCCTVTDKYGNSEDIWFYIIIDNGFKAYPSDAENHDNESITYNIKPNESKTIYVTDESDDKDGINYKWCKWYDNNWNIISGATSN
ncbi:MAG: hypothetical protein IJ619_05360, partial [Eubacterium sp.]|nr:hypothetical protein [Eubacterium sp.]